MLMMLQYINHRLYVLAFALQLHYFYIFLLLWYWLSILTKKIL